MGKLKKIDLLDVVGWVTNFFKEVEPMNLVPSWRKLLDHSANKFSGNKEAATP